MSVYSKAVLLTAAVTTGGAISLLPGCGRQPNQATASTPSFAVVPAEHLNVNALGRSSLVAANGDLLIPASVYADFPEERSASKPLGFMRISIDDSGHDVSVHGALVPGDGNRRDGLDPYFHGFELGGSLFVAGFLGVTEHGPEAWDNHYDDGLILRLVDDDWTRVATFGCEPLGIVSVVPLDAESVMLLGVCGNNLDPARNAPPIVLHRFDGKTLQPVEHELEGELIGAARSGEHVYVATTNNVRAYSTVTGDWTNLGDVGLQRSSGAIRAITPLRDGVAIGGRFSRVGQDGGFENVALLRVGDRPARLGGIATQHAELREKLGEYEPVEALCVLSDGRLLAGGANPMRLAVFDDGTGYWVAIDADFEAIDESHAAIDAAGLPLQDLAVITRLHAFPEQPAVVLEALGVPEGDVIRVEPGELYTTPSGGTSVNRSNAPLRVLPPKRRLIALARFETVD